MTITNLTPQQVHDALVLPPQTPFVSDMMQLVDVRDHDEIQQSGKIHGALRMSYRSPLFEPALNDLDRHRKLVFQCASGRRSLLAANIALQLGFKHVFNMVGGFNQWKAENRPIESNPPLSPWVHTVMDPATDTAQYIVTDLDSQQAVVIDPVLDYDPLAGVVSPTTAKTLVAFIQRHQLHVTHLLDTHVHADHLTASWYIKEALDPKPEIWISKDVTKVQHEFAQRYNINTKTDFDGKRFDRLIGDGDTWSLGRLTCLVVATPGHTPACLSYRIGDAAFVGDSLFMPDLGTARCDFPGGSAHTLYHSIQTMYTTWPDDTRIYVGHDYPPLDQRKYDVMTLLGHQKQYNKMIHSKVTLDEFVARRTARDQMLKPPRLIHPSLQTNLRGGMLPDKEKHFDGKTTQEAGPFFKIPVQWQA
ncbi:beta-lactamase-like protein [Absidia repens]|uniref:Beta-lactamase-like protein n=1 Tax=Absidia repens TaxID=90262 RepID=A0A1X2HYU4_9FUNG|nr:beta-lactamase-like protein [Absidia repens]